MTDHSDNVVVHPTAARAGREQAARLEALRATMGQLDELSDRLQRISPHSDWPAKRWVIASTPFRMRLAGTRRRLDDLGRLDPLDEHNSIRWMLDLGHARYNAEHQLHAIMACLHVLQRADASPAERARETEIFAFSRSELLTELREIRHLIARRFPAVLGER
jgi:hypothetical protein